MLSLDELKLFLKVHNPSIRSEMDMLVELKEFLEKTTIKIGEWSNDLRDHAGRDFINISDIDLAIKACNLNDFVFAESFKEKFIHHNNLIAFLNENNVKVSNIEAIEHLSNILQSIALKIFNQAKVLTFHADRKKITKNDVILAIKFLF